MKLKDGYAKTLQIIYKLGIKREKKRIIEIENLKRKLNKKWKNGKSSGISILTGTAFAVQCSTHWAAENLPWMESEF